MGDLGMILVGLVMGVLGWAMFTDLRGMSTWHVKRTLGLRPESTLERPNDQRAFRYQFRIDPLIGAGFMVCGTLVVLGGLIDLVD